MAVQCNSLHFGIGDLLNDRRAGTASCGVVADENHYHAGVLTLDWQRARFYAARHQLSRVAQLVEQVTVNHRVGGSSPSSGVLEKHHTLDPCGNESIALVAAWLCRLSGLIGTRSRDRGVRPRKRTWSR